MEHHHDMASLDCDGQELGHEYGSWIGHIVPGAVFITWGVWHMLNVFWTYTSALAQDGHDRRYRSLASYRLHVGQGRHWPVESVLKVVGPIVGMTMELWTGGSYQALICEKNTAHPGWFHGDNINNWQHAILYPPIILSGLVDLLSTCVTLPRGAQHAFLALVFAFEGLVMGSHTKPVPLDNVVHQYLAMTSSALAAVTLLELFLSKHVIAATARTALMVLQGTWLCAIGRIMFERRPAWDTHIMAPHDYVPVLYCWHIVFIAAGALGLYVCVSMWQEHVAPRVGPAYSPLSAQLDQPNGDCSSSACAPGAAHSAGKGHGGRAASDGPVLPVSTKGGDVRGASCSAPRGGAHRAGRHHRYGSGSSSELELSCFEVTVGDGEHSGSGSGVSSDQELASGEMSPLRPHTTNPAYGARMDHHAL